MPEGIDRLQLLQIQAAVQAGYRKCEEKYGKAKPFMSLNQYYKKYGYGIGQNWIDAKIVNPIRQGKNTSKWQIRVEEAELAAITYNPELLCKEELKPCE